MIRAVWIAIATVAFAYLVFPGPPHDIKCDLW